MSCAKIEPVYRIKTNGDMLRSIHFHIEEHQIISYEKLLKAEKPDTMYRIQAIDKMRSPQQNNLFHGPILDTMVNWTGDTDTEYWKVFFKRKFLRVKNENGKWETLHTSKLTIQEFNAFIAKCVQWIMDEGGGQYLPSDIIPM